MANTKLIAMILIGIMVVKTEECDLLTKSTDRVCNSMSNTTSVTCGAGTTCPSGAHEITLVFLWGNLLCYTSCFATVGATSVVAGPAVLATLGFTSTGIAAGSWAAGWMASYGGSVTAGGLFATLQGVGATGAMKWTGIPYVNAVCKHLCY